MTSMSKIKPEATDADNPAITPEEMAKLRPAAEIFGGQGRLNKLLGRTGRPRLGEKTKVNATLRLSPDVLDAYKAEGKGWQARIDEILRAHMPGRR